VRSLTYGVSPHPAHAPEYSKSGCMNCAPFTSILIAGTVHLGQVEEEGVVRALALAQRHLRRHVDRVLCFGFDLSLAGQTMTQSVHPVQSSGAL